MKNTKGITLVSLVITIVVLLILSSIATYSGINVINSSKLTAFTTELKIMQTQVNAIYQKYKDNDTIEIDGTIYYGEAESNKQDTTNKTMLDIGQELTGDIKEQADKIFTLDASEVVSSEGYQYWSKELIKQLGIEGIEQDFFVNLEKRSVVSYQGFKYEGKMYYTLSQLPNGLYNVEYIEPSAEKPTFDVNAECIGVNKWRITISNIRYDGYIDKWQVKYQLEGKSYWNTAEDLSFVVNEDGNYKIQVANGEIVSEEKTKYLGYIQDGLRLHYDGIKNTRSGNNPSATSWEDLSGNNNDGIFYNINTKPETVTDTDSGYYSSEEKGYVFLYNDSYVQSTNTIGISGDDNYTIEIVSNIWEEGKNSNYSPNTAILAQPAWWGSSSSTVGTSCMFGYSRQSKKLSLGFINNGVYSNEGYNLIGKTSYMSFRKIKVGQIQNGDTDIVKMNYNSQDIPNTYTGTATFTPNLVDSEVQVGRAWQWNGENRPFYGSIQAIRIYNRVLTDEEIEENYKIDKVRFNIP